VKVPMAFEKITSSKEITFYKVIFDHVFEVVVFAEVSNQVTHF
jgi:hypothetical protein